MRRTVPLLLVALVATGCGTVTVPSTAAGPAPGWEAAPASPLSPRHGARAVTVGGEVLLLGGDAAPLCPPAASCVDPPQPLRDGAAYDPEKRTWRPLASAPVAPSSGAVAVLDGTVYVLSEQRLHAYDPAADTWTELPAPPDGDGLLVAAGEHLLRMEPTQEGGRVEADHLYDPGARTWRALPRDPLAPTFDRGAVWTGDRLVLLGKPEPPPPVDGVDSPTVFVHAAAFDVGTWTWTPVPQKDEVLGFGTSYSWTGSRVLVPYVFDYTDGGRNPGGTPEPTGGLLDPDTGDWKRLPPSPRPPADGLRLDAATAELVTAGEGLVLDVPASRWHLLLPAEGAPDEGVTGSWVGRRLVVFGGGDTSEAGRTPTADAYVWTAPD